MDERDNQLLLLVRPTLLPEGDRESTLRLLARVVEESSDEAMSSEGVFADAWERELVESTYIGLGMAVPHARVAGLQRARICVAFSQAGIPWPHEEAHFITLLVVPWENPEMHLQLLSRLVRWRRMLTEAEVCALAESPDQLEASLNDAFQDML